MKKAITFSLLFLVGCDYYDNRLEVINHTNSEITVETYSDTIPDFPSVNKTEFYLSQRGMPADTITLTMMGKNGWPFAIAKSKNKRLNLIVYSIDSLRKYKSIDTLIKREIYKRYEFTEDEIKDKDWTVVLR